jgi:hypothetical protein
VRDLPAGHILGGNQLQRGAEHPAQLRRGGLDPHLPRCCPHLQHPRTQSGDGRGDQLDVSGISTVVGGELRTGDWCGAGRIGQLGTATQDHRHLDHRVHRYGVGAADRAGQLALFPTGQRA